MFYSENEFPSFEAEKKYYTDLTAPLFLAPGGMLGMSYAQMSFRNNYNDLLYEFLLVFNNFAEGGYLYFYDEERDYIVFLIDSTEEVSFLHAYPAMIRHPSAAWKEITYGSKGVTDYEKVLYDLSYCYINCPVLDKETNEVIAYVGFNFDLEKLTATRNDFIRTTRIISVGVMVLITGIYLLFAEMFLIKNIHRLSVSTVAFTKKLDSGKELTCLDNNVKSKDEIGTLSGNSTSCNIRSWNTWI